MKRSQFVIVCTLLALLPAGRAAAAPSAAAAAAKSDTTAKHPKRRTLLLAPADTTYKADTNKVARQFAFRINTAANDIITIPLDTSLRQHYIDNPLFLNDVGAVYLGGLSSAAMSYDYFARDMRHEFLFAQPYSPYFYSTKNALHLNTTTPYSLLYYAWTRDRRSEDMTIKANYAMNITNRMSAGVFFNNIGTKGIYQRQNNRVFALSAFVSYLGEYYSANGGFIYNHARMQENGGLVDDAVIFDPNFDTPDGAAVALAQARSQIWQQTYYLSHSVDLPLYYIGSDSVITNIIKARFGHAFEWSAYRRLYTDNEDASADSAYYKDYFLNRTKSRDSIAFRRMENRLFVQLRPLRAYIFEQVSAGLGWRNFSHYMFAPSMYLTGLQHGGMTAAFVYAGASAWYKRYFLWRAYGESVFAGYEQGNVHLDADLRLSVYPIRDGLHLTARAEFNRYQPSYFYGQYASNHYAWGLGSGNAPAAQTITDTRIEAMLSIPQTSTSAAFKYGLHTNYAYFDDDKQLRQHAQALNVIALSIRQDFALWHFKFRHHLLLQRSSAPSVMDVPLAAAAFTYYWDYDFTPILGKKVIRIELGVDARYCTSFRGYGYDPALGAFHTSPQQLGGYVWADLFVAAQWYWAVPFVRWEHANHNLWEQPTGFWGAAHYPRNFRVFKFGLAWRFFD